MNFLKIVLNKFACFIIVHPLYAIVYMPKWLILIGWYLFLELDRWALLRIERLDIINLQKIQRERLRQLLLFIKYHEGAWQKSPNGPVSTNSITDIRTFPIFTREALGHENNGVFLIKKTPAWRRKKILTSGTTTDPAVVYGDITSFIRMEAMLKSVIGFKRNKKLVRANLKFPPFRPLGTILLFSFAGDLDFHIRSIASHFEKFNPTHIFGPTSTILDLASMFDMKKFHYAFDSVWTVSEYLYEDDKLFMENIFGCQVLSIYASREAAGPIAFECSAQNGMHINMASFMIEILDEDGNDASAGVEGNIVVTMFDNRVMPFIRYKIGDRGFVRHESCHCGRNSPRLFLRGRETQFVTLKNNKMVSLLSVVGFIRDHSPGFIRQFQFIQNEPGEIIARIVTSGIFDESAKDEIARDVARRFVGNLVIKLESAEYIQGKNLLFINNLKKNRSPINSPVVESGSG